MDIILYKNYTKNNNSYYSYKEPESERAEKEAYRSPEGWEVEPCEMGDIFHAPDGNDYLFADVFSVDDDGRPLLAYDADSGEAMEFLLEKL